MAGRQIRVAVSHRITSRSDKGSPSSDSGRPNRSSSKAPRSSSARSNETHPSPPASRSTVSSCRTLSVTTGTGSLSTAGVPSSHVASATNASVGSVNGRPTRIRHACSRSATSFGSSASHDSAPTATALFRTTGGMSIMVGNFRIAGAGRYLILLHGQFSDLPMEAMIETCVGPGMSTADHADRCGGGAVVAQHDRHPSQLPGGGAPLGQPRAGRYYCGPGPAEPLADHPPPQAPVRGTPATRWCGRI